MLHKIDIESRLRNILPSDLMASATFVCVINSVAEGFSNSTSDIDLMVVTSDLVNLPYKQEEWLQLFDGHTRFDTLVITEAWLTEKISLIGQQNVDRHNLDFLHKIRAARPVHGSARWRSLIDDINWFQFDRELVNLYAEEVRDIPEDIAGNLAEGDLLSAARNGKTLVETSVDMLLASRGESQPRRKWRIKKLRRSFGPDSPVLASYANIEFVGGMSDEYLLHTLIPACMRFYRCVQRMVFFPQSTSTTIFAPRPVSTYSSALLASCGRLNDFFFALNPTPLMKLSREELLIWFIGMTAPSQEAVASEFRAIAKSGTDGIQPRSDEEVFSTLRLLTTRALLAPPSEVMHTERV